jgi:hypothetical protein
VVACIRRSVAARGSLPRSPAVLRSCGAWGPVGARNTRCHPSDGVSTVCVAGKGWPACAASRARTSVPQVAPSRAHRGGGTSSECRARQRGARARAPRVAGRDGRSAAGQRAVTCVPSSGARPARTADGRPPDGRAAPGRRVGVRVEGGRLPSLTFTIGKRVGSH